MPTADVPSVRLSVSSPYLTIPYFPPANTVLSNFFFANYFHKINAQRDPRSSTSVPTHKYYIIHKLNFHTYWVFRKRLNTFRHTM